MHTYFKPGTILACAAAAVLLALLPGCATVALTDLTPSSLQENPSQIYTFTLRVTPKTHQVQAASIAPHIIIDGQNFPMKPSSLGQNIYEFEYQLPPGRSQVAYYYLVDYRVEGNGVLEPGQAYTETQHSAIVRHYVLTLEANRGPVGSTIGVLGRGFSPQDKILLNGTEAPRTVYSSPTSLSFVVPPVPAGVYQVSIRSEIGNMSVGAFRVDASSVTVEPSSLTLTTGRKETLTFTVTTAAPESGLLLDVTTNIPESIVMPEVVVPAGQTSVSVPVQGGRPGSGSLVLKGFGEPVTIPVTVNPR